MEERTCANKSSFNFFRLIRPPFFFLFQCGKPADPPPQHQLIPSIKAIFKQARCLLRHCENIMTHKTVN